MNRDEIVAGLEMVARVRKQWRDAIKQHQTDEQSVMRRLLLEAAHNFMSAADVARASGLTIKRVRAMMRENGLSPHLGKRTLSDTAAAALVGNAEQLGIDPREMDLRSPLAYLPMGEQMKRSLQDRTISKVTETEEHEHTSDCAVDRPCPDDVGGIPELVHGINFWDDEIGCGTDTIYQRPLLMTFDVDQITCEPCRKALVKGA